MSHQTEIKNYGFDESKIVIEPEDFVLGSTSTLPNIIYRPDGQWPTPVYEAQADKYETNGCTVWGTENQIEMFVKEVYGFEPNYDERFTYNKVGIRRENGGANPQFIYQSIRHDGLIPNEPLPDTYEEFVDKSYLTKEREAVGLKWRGEEFELYHDWLTGITKETIKANLAYSPIAIAVTAWMVDSDGLYIDNGLPNTHWCVAFGYLEEWKGKSGIYLKVFDSYDHSVKILHPDHRISYAKRIWLRKRDVGENEVIQSTFYSLLIAGLAWLFPFWVTKYNENKTKPAPQPVVEPPKKESRLTLWADAIESFESGGNKNSVSYRRNNPGNLKNLEGEFIVYATYEAGYAALCNYLLRSATDQHRAYVAKAKALGKKSSGDLTLKEFIEVYAPDGPLIVNNYSTFIANKCGVTNDTQIKNLL